MNIKLLTEHHLKFLSFKGGCTGSSESTLVKMPHYWKSHDTAHLLLDFSITVKVSTLIFISGRGSAISSAKQENSGFIYNLVKS